VWTAVAAVVPAGATVAVVSKGDEELLALPGRTARHFPQRPDGSYLGYNPEPEQTVPLLEAARGRGAQYLVLPETAFWWLEDYPEFRRHLNAHCRRVHADPNCIIYRLTGPGPAP
jgi:hypothetical protein